MNRKLYWYRQLVDPPDLNDAWDGAELADQRIVLDTSVGLLLSGVAVAEAGSPNLTVQVSAGVGYDQLGQRVSVPSTQVVDASVDYLSALTEVTGPGNEKWLSVFLVFQRDESDPFVDGNSVPGFFTRDEGYVLRVYQGAEAPAGTANRPALISPGLLLADVLIDDTTTQILDAAISVTRRQDSVVIAGTAHSVRRGHLRDALADVAGWLDDHLTGVANNHVAAGIDYAGGGTWADGTTNPAATVEAQLDKIVLDLSATASSGGIVKIGAGALVGASSTIIAGTLFAALTALKSAANIDLAARTAWLGGRTNPAATLFAGVDKIVTDLAATTSSDDGCERIGAQASGNFGAGSARSQIDELTGTGANNDGAKRVGTEVKGTFTGVTVRAQLDDMDTLKAPKASPTFTGTITAGVINASGEVTVPRLAPGFLDIGTIAANTQITNSIGYVRCAQPSTNTAYNIALPTPASGNPILHVRMTGSIAASREVYITDTANLAVSNPSDYYGIWGPADAAGAWTFGWNGTKWEILSATGGVSATGGGTLA